ncbi:hypothetical protein GOODEAATRI_028940 [Goodea atripinnis]|uniref:Secreted protein n=1 Tax=Goodea atripinnis TaxID=208336 RepID=A0ABV0P8P4_9TELE
MHHFTVVSFVVWLYLCWEIMVISNDGSLTRFQVECGSCVSMTIGPGVLVLLGHQETGERWTPCGAGLVEPSDMFLHPDAALTDLSQVMVYRVGVTVGLQGGV